MNTPTVTAATIVDWGDVVNVVFSLYEDQGHIYPIVANDITQENIDLFEATGSGFYVYVSRSAIIPAQVSYFVPEASTQFLDKFREELVGAELNVVKWFIVDKEDAYTDPTHDLYNMDLFYEVTITEILYDASDYAVTSDSTTTTTRRNPIVLPFQGDMGVFAMGAGVAISIGGFALWQFRSRRIMKSVTSQEDLSTSMREKVIKKDRNTIKELRKLTDSYSTSDVVPPSSDQSDVKFRRRRK